MTSTTPENALDQVDPVLDDASNDVRIAFADAVAAVTTLVVTVKASHAAADQLVTSLTPTRTAAPTRSGPAVPDRLLAYTRNGTLVPEQAVAEALQAVVAATVDVAELRLPAGPPAGFDPRVTDRRAADFATRYTVGLEAQA